MGEQITTTWTEIGPINIQDLDSEWDDEGAISFWLEFYHPTLEDDTDVRIGWIKLTE